MFVPENEIVYAALTFLTIGVAIWYSDRLEKRNEVLEGRVNTHRERAAKATWQWNAYSARYHALEHTVGSLNTRIGEAIRRGMAHPNTRPGKILDILVGLDDDLHSPVGEKDERRFMLLNPEDIVYGKPPLKFNKMPEHDASKSAAWRAMRDKYKADLEATLPATAEQVYKALTKNRT